MICTITTSFPQFNDLEELGYVGFGIGFYEDKTEIVGTSTTKECFTGKIIDYLHAMIIAGK